MLPKAEANSVPNRTVKHSIYHIIDLHCISEKKQQSFHWCNIAISYHNS